MVQEKRPNLVFSFFMEIKLSTQCMERIRIKTGFDNAFAVDSRGRSGGLALLWNDELCLEIHNYSWNHINAVVRIKD
jgi:hypothetical protein